MQKYFWVEFSEVRLERAVIFNTYISFICVISMFMFVRDERDRSWKLNLLYKIYLFFYFFTVILSFLYFRFLRLRNCRFFFLNLTYLTFGMFSFSCFNILLVFYSNFILRLKFLFVQSLF